MPGPTLEFKPPVEPLSANGITLDGRTLIVPEGYIFPPLCLGSGEIAGLEPQTIQRVSALAPWITALLVAGVLPYLIVALILTSHGSFSCRFTKRMIKRWRLIRMAGWCVCFASLCLLCRGIVLSSVVLCVVWLIPFALGCLLANGSLGGIKAAAVKEGKIWLPGIPKRVCRQIIVIESRRAEAVRKAAAAPQALSNLPAAV